VHPVPRPPTTIDVDPAPLYLTAFLVVGLSVSILGPALSELRDRTGSTLGAIGVLFVTQSLGYIAGSLGGGAALDRMHGHRLFAGSLIVMGLALGMVPHMSELVGEAIVFGVLGVGASAVDLGANTMLIWHRGSEVGRSMNLLHLCFGIGALSSPLLMQLGLGIAATGGAIAAFLIAGWALLVPPPHAPVVKRDDQTDTTLGLLALAAMFFVLYVGLEVGFGGWIHTYGEEIHFSSAGATWLTALFWTSFTLGRLLAAWLAHKVVPKTLLAGACTLAVVSALALTIADGAPAVVWPATALFGLAVAPQFPVMFTYLERRINVTGSATSWFVCGAGVGGLVFPWLIGQWFDRSGADAMPLATTLLAIATLAWFVLLNRVFVARSRSLPRSRGVDLEA
jgi:fucose permease